MPAWIYWVLAYFAGSMFTASLAGYADAGVEDADALNTLPWLFFCVAGLWPLSLPCLLVGLAYVKTRNRFSR